MGYMIHVGWCEGGQEGGREVVKKDLTKVAEALFLSEHTLTYSMLK